MKAQKVEQSLPTWDLSALYPNKESSELKNDLQNVEDRAKRFQKIFENKIIDLDGETLASTVKEYEEIEETLGRLHSFAYLLYAENISSEENSAFYQNISEKITEISTLILFFELEINKISDQEIEAKYSSSDELKKYEPWIRDVRVMKPYQLSDEVEKILHEKSITSRQSWHRLFEETIADLRFPFDEQKLTAAEVMNLMSSKNEEERKKAAKSVGNTLGANIKTFALITNVLAKDKEINDRWRKFVKPISSRNLANLIEDEVAEALISSEKISWDVAVDTVIEAYSDFSPEMAKIGKRFFDENWIDAPAREGKDSGAFSHPTVPSAHPYILMNFQGKIRDVMTLAHELGHGVHQCLAAEQGALMASTPLTLAETASVFGEQLTFRKLLERQESEQQKKIMIANKVEDMLNTVVRQIAFCEFERQVHDERKNGEIPAERLCEIWLDVQKESLGPAIKFDDEYKYFWSYIPHFIHTPFYVYAYAFGDCLVNSLYKVYQDSPDGFVEKYIEMLKAGGTLRHKELLAPFGLDASDPKFWQGGLDIISSFVDQLN